MITDSPFVEVDFAQQSKHGQGSPGDVFISNRSFDDGRIVCVLADGLGSGIKANVLATLTSTMAMKYVSSDMDIKKAAAVIMSTLPICSQRKIGYSTFTIVDIRPDGNVSVIEYDNPSYVLLNGRNYQSVEKNDILIDAPNIGQRVLHFSHFKAEEGHKLVLYTDGITQSGMGSEKMPLGWTQECAEEFVTEKVNAFEGISARDLSRDVVTRALGNDRFKAKDDISCAVINFRKPRKMLVLTGPPINKDRDRDMALILKEFEGKKAICGGTTANIAARELGLEVEVVLSNFDPEIPPPSKMKGVDLITEGTITMSKAAELLEAGKEPEKMKTNAAVSLMKHFLESDIIEFVVGTKINEAHQDPNLPVELAIRRNLIRHIVSMLNEKYMKQASFQFI